MITITAHDMPERVGCGTTGGEEECACLCRKCQSRDDLCICPTCTDVHHDHKARDKGAASRWEPWSPGDGLEAGDEIKYRKVWRDGSVTSGRVTMAWREYTRGFPYAVSSGGVKVPLVQAPSSSTSWTVRRSKKAPCPDLTYAVWGDRVECSGCGRRWVHVAGLAGAPWHTPGSQESNGTVAAHHDGTGHILTLHKAAAL